jgi:hypothetical protein
MKKLFNFIKKQNTSTDNDPVKKTVIGFIEGEIGPKEFLEMFQRTTISIIGFKALFRRKRPVTSILHT